MICTPYSENNQMQVFLCMSNFLLYSCILFCYASFTLYNPFSFGSCVFCAPLDRYIGQHSSRVSTDVSVDISAKCRPIRRSTCWSTYRLVYWSICLLTSDRYVGRYVNRVVVRLSTDMSIDRLPTFCRYFTATCPGCVTWNKVIHIASCHYLRTFWERCLLQNDILKVFFIYIFPSK